MTKTENVGKARLVALFDQGTFAELGAFVRRNDGSPEGVTCGYGAIAGRLVFAFAQDSAAMKGAVDANHAKKLLALYEKALAAGAPVVGLFDSAGAVLPDGAAALGAYGTILNTVSGAKGKIPQIAVIAGNCGGTMAAVAALFDTVTVIRGASCLYVTSPSLMQKADGSADAAFENGNADIVCDTEAEAFGAVRSLLELLPDNAFAAVAPAPPTDDPNRATALAATCRADEALAAIADNGSYLALGAAKDGVLAALTRMGGVACGALAFDGALSLGGVRRAVRLLKLCNAFSMPVVTLVNCEGYSREEKDEAAMPTALAELAATLALSTAPRVSVITGKAIGAGFILCGAGALGADTVLALQKTEIAALSAEAAVAFLENDKITPEVTRASLEEKFRLEEAAPENAAAAGEIDDVVDSAELRARVIAALYMLRGKAERGTARVRATLL